MVSNKFVSEQLLVDKGQDPMTSTPHNICKQMSKRTLVFRIKETLFAGSHVNDSAYHQRTIKNFFDCSTKLLTDMVKCKGNRFVLTKSKRFRGCRKRHSDK